MWGLDGHALGAKKQNLWPLFGGFRRGRLGTASRICGEVGRMIWKDILRNLEVSPIEARTLFQVEWFWERQRRMQKMQLTATLGRFTSFSCFAIRRLGTAINAHCFWQCRKPIMVKIEWVKIWGLLALGSELIALEIVEVLKARRSSNLLA